MFAQMAKLSNSNFYPRKRKVENMPGVYGGKKVNGEFSLKYRYVPLTFIHIMHFLFYFSRIILFTFRKKK